VAPYINHSDVSPQPLQLSPHITSYLKSQEEMMKKFQEQLNEKIQLLNTELEKQRSSLETLKEQLQERNNSKPQVRDQFHASGKRETSKGPGQPPRG